MNKEELKDEIMHLKEDLRVADGYFISCSNKLQAAEKEVDELKRRLNELEVNANTFAVCEETHYALEECRFRNLQLEKDISDTDDLKSQITFLYSVLSKTDALWHQSEEKERKWEKVATKLYSVTLHLEEIAKSSLVVVVGPGLYSEAVDAIKEYKKIQND